MRFVNLFPFWKKSKESAVSTAFREASESIVSILDLPKLLDYILKIIVTELDVEMASVYLKNDEGKGFLQVARKEKANAAVPKKVFLPLEDPLAQKLRETRAPLSREDAETDGVLAMPLFFHKELLGMFILGRKSSGEKFTPADLEMLGAFSNQAIVAIQNAKLFQQLTLMKTYNENILRSMTSGVLTVDNDHRITLVNAAAEKLLGKKSSELLGQNTRVLGEGLSSLLKKTMLESALFSAHEIEYGMNGQAVRAFAVSTSPLTDSHYERQGAIAVMNDITEMKELQRRVQKGEKLATIGTMAAGLAHEIKNPLVAVKTFMDLLPAKYEDEEFRVSFGQLVRQELDRINEIVTGLLDFAHPKKPVMGQANLENILGSVLGLLSLQAKDAKVEITHSIASPLPPVEADSEQIGRVFMNIALNAIQAMQNGGKLEVKAQRKGDEVEISFSDNGPGISPQNLQKIFDPFFTTKHKGTGLGLSICLKIAQDHRGDIRVKSSSAGTTFTVVLPAAKA